MKNEYGNCIECLQKDSHYITCSLIDVDQAKEEIKKLLNQLQKERIEFRNRQEFFSNGLRRLRHDVSFWQGKYHTVKNENNKLRKKL